MHKFNEIDSEIHPSMSKIRAHSRYLMGYNYALLKRYICLLVSTCLISTIIFSTVFYLNINYVYNLYPNKDVPNSVQNPSVIKSQGTKNIQSNKKNSQGLSIYDLKIKYNDFNYLNSETLTYENRTYTNNIKILFRMPKKRDTIGLLLIFHGCSRSAHDWFHTVERQRIIGAAIDLGYGCLAFKTTDQATSCWLGRSDLDNNEDVQMVLKGLDNFYKEYPKLESLPRFTFGSSSGGIFSSIFVTNQRYKIQGQILFISIIQPDLLETHIKAKTYPPTAWIYMPRDIEFASEARINNSIKIFLKEKIPYQSFIIKPISLTRDTFHQRIPTIESDTSHYIYFRFQQNQWLDEKNHIKYNPRQEDSWKTFLFTSNNSTPEVTKLIENIKANENNLPDFLNTIYGQHEISFERSYEALKWHLCIYNNQTNCTIKCRLKKGKNETNQLVGAIDQGTSSSRFLIFNASNLELITYHQETIEILTPNPGWVEQDPNEILEKTVLCMEKAVEQLEELGYHRSDIKAIGVTNQRETTILWDKETGKVLYNAIVWLDARTQETVDFLLGQYNKRRDCLQEQCGLPISTYFSALKIRWLMDNSEDVRKAIDQRRCFFGTVDSWLLYNLVSDNNKTVHATDVTNASRTMLMNIRNLQWDAQLCQFFSIPEHILPEIKSSSTIFGYINKGALRGIPVTAVLGDQQAALVGQQCWSKGSAKSTYGTGCFILYNTGEDLAYSRNGLLTTVAYKWNDDDAVYALEGSIAIAGECIKWLRDNLGIIPDSKSTETIAASVKDTGGVYFVPAFSGLFAPYWRSDARGLIMGMTQYTTKAHIVRAALEGICYQTREIVDAMYDDSGVRLSKLKVDGGMANNKLFLQMLSNIVGINVATPSLSETTALGAALAAGKAKGIDLFTLEEDSEVKTVMSTYTPRIQGQQREDNFAAWKKAVIKSFERLTVPFNIENKGLQEQKSYLSSRTVGWITLTSIFGILLYMASRHHS